MLQKLIAGCPSIQELGLLHCFKLTEIIITSLKRLEVYKCPRFKSINVDAPCLDSFWYNWIRRQSCNFKFSERRSLKELVLEYSILTDKMFEREIVELPNL
ncbi:hypothetical protein Droror1_Dr00009867 [Drosera rotundifolia]